MRENQCGSSGYTRRDFLGEASCAALSGSAAFSSILNLSFLGDLAADELPVGGRLPSAGLRLSLWRA